MRPRSALVVMGVLFAACGQSDPTTVVNGSAAGLSMSLPTAFFTKVPGGLLQSPTKILVLISDDPSGCADATSSVNDPGMGQNESRNQVIDPSTQRAVPSLFLDIVEGKDAYELSEVATPNRSLPDDIHASFDTGCAQPVEVPLTDGGGNCWHLLGGPCGIKLWPDGGTADDHPCLTDVALSGTGEFDGDSSTVAEGRFKLTFSDGSFSGSFNASPCPSLAVVSTLGCSSSQGDLIPALLASGWIWRRRRIKVRTR